MLTKESILFPCYTILIVLLLLLQANGFIVPLSPSRLIHRNRAPLFNFNDKVNQNCGQKFNDIHQVLIDSNQKALLHQRKPSSFYRTSSTQLFATNSPLKSGRNQKLPTTDGDYISYDGFFQEDSTKCWTVMYLPRLFGEKNSPKATSLEVWSKRQGYNFVCADYYGMGRSSGEFDHANVSRWTTDTILLLEKLIKSKKTILVGAGVGGWIMLLIALKRPDLVSGLVGMAADPDFTEELIWNGLSELEKNAITNTGTVEITWGGVRYTMTKTLIEDGRKNLLIHDITGGEKVVKNSLPVACPVRLIHGFNDNEVPYTTSLKIADAIRNRDVKVIFQKMGDHHLDEEDDFYTMKAAIVDVIDHDRTIEMTNPGSG